MRASSDFVGLKRKVEVEQSGTTVACVEEGVIKRTNRRNESVDDFEGVRWFGILRHVPNLVEFNQNACWFAVSQQSTHSNSCSHM